MIPAAVLKSVLVPLVRPAAMTAVATVVEKYRER